MMKKSAGFTLIELMIVIAIIGILAAVAVPNFLNARDRARVSAAASAVHTIRTALEMYMVDEDCYPEDIGKTDLAQLSNQITNRDGVLKNFLDDKIDSYTGGINAYTFEVTCRDRPVRTRLKATMDGIWINEDANNDQTLDGWDRYHK